MNWPSVLQIMSSSLNPQHRSLRDKLLNEKLKIMLYHPLTPRSNSVRDELTSSADDNDDTPESLIPLSMEYENKTI